MAELIGQQLGNYRLLRLLGEGGFAEVYLGEHVHLKTQAAIKVLHTRLAQDDMQSFLQEARTIAQLDHPHIVRVLEFGIENQPPLQGTPFLVMTYAPNGTLRLRHPRGTKVPLDQIVTYVRQIAEALQHAHNQRFIHRDIKPENMLLGRNNEVLLSDFGLALLAQSSRYQSTKEVIGTAAYMAPEQLNGKPLPASDQYSLAIVVYEWLCGERPFQGTFVELYSQHLNVPPDPLHKRVPGLSRDIAQVVHRALAKEPRYRFPSVQEFAGALAQAYEPTAIRPPAIASQPPQGAESLHSLTTLPQSSTGQPPSGPPQPPPQSQPLQTPVQPYAVSQPPPVASAPGAGRPSQPYISSGTQGVSQPGSVTLPATAPPRRSSKGKVLGIIGVVVVVVLLLCAITASQVLHMIPGTANNPANNANAPGSTVTTGNNSTNNNAPTPTATVAPGTVIYQASFDQNDMGNWSSDSSQQWKQIGDGTLGSDGTSGVNSNDGFIFWYLHAMPTQNYAIEAKIQFVRLTNPDPNSTFENTYYDFGIMVRGDGNQNGYELGIEGDDNQYQSCDHAAMIKLVQKDTAPDLYLGSGGCHPDVLAKAAYTLDHGTHTYRVEVNGNSLKLFLDGQSQPVVSTTDNTYVQAGRVGLRSVYADINVLSFKVTAL